MAGHRQARASRRRPGIRRLREFAAGENQIGVRSLPSGSRQREAQRSYDRSTKHNTDIIARLAAWDHKEPLLWLDA
jgi:hypothetical protein